MENLLGDLKFAARMLAKKPLQTAVAILTLAIGIGANTAIFSVVNAVILRPLPYPDPERIYVVWGNHPNVGDETASAPDYVDLRDQNGVLSSMGALKFASLNLSGDGDPERVVGARIEQRAVATLGLEASLGRFFEPAEDVPKGPSVAVLSHGLWQRRYGGDPGALGTQIVINGVPHTIVGVAPPEVAFPRVEPAIYVPLQLDPSATGRRSDELYLVGRLAPGVTPERAEAELKGIMARLEQQYPATNTGWTVRLEPLHETMVKEVRPLLLILLGAVACVLLIACANVANLLLARATGRQREIAIRAALGAGRLRIVRQLLTEGLLLAVAGAAVGLGLSPWALDALVALAPAGLDIAESARLDPTVLAFTALLAVATGVVFGLAPAMQLARTRLQETLKDGGRGVAGDSRRWLRGGLVAAQVGLAVVLLVGVGLLVRSFNNLLGVELGFDPDRLATAAVTLPAARYDGPERQAAFYDVARERLAALPGVETVSVATAPPIYGGGPWLSFSEMNVQRGPEEVSDTNVRMVDPGYFSALGIPLRAGRGFTEADGINAPRVAVVNETMARRFWPGESPIGKRLAFDTRDGEPVWREVVGVAADVRHEGPSEEEVRGLYVPYPQRPTSTMFFLVRTQGDPAEVGAAIRREIAAIDPALPAYAVNTMDRVLSNSLSARRFAMSLIGAFGAVALFLAAIGIYAVMAYVVAQQTREIGIRMALGASRGDVVRWVLGRGLALALGGLALGAAAAFGLSRLLGTMLYGVGPADPVAFGAAAALLGAAAALACLVPARRAARVDPMVALRYE